ncbi:hypothetical protein BURMUCGD2M_0173 [Burkholderia multivorans CGD2M]|uniref:Uncharacterized protein n=1 Tax=Burkholderia multivorans CGD2 TaxID=513052 RepID=B9C060_9BURK|nr:hypothetical protein BURMUCGD2_0174 [Burkholderia multivorans CGD2]EEE10185.1 hypothetical protein BURMUCGD2M_0173 [Burkholderia multivorans CGD2M]EJO59736.1 hypothetical protein BURMUCF2_3597 [Burkholderia multivorans CF2]
MKRIHAVSSEAEGGPSCGRRVDVRAICRVATPGPGERAGVRVILSRRHLRIHANC